MLAETSKSMSAVFYYVTWESFYIKMGKWLGKLAIFYVIKCIELTGCVTQHTYYTAFLLVFFTQQQKLS